MLVLLVRLVLLGRWVLRGRLVRRVLIQLFRVRLARRGQREQLDLRGLRAIQGRLVLRVQQVLPDRREVSGIPVRLDRLEKLVLPGLRVRPVLLALLVLIQR